MVVKPRSANIEDIAVILHVNQTDDELENYSYNYPLSELRSQDEEKTNLHNATLPSPGNGRGACCADLVVGSWREY